MAKKDQADKSKNLAATSAAKSAQRRRFLKSAAGAASAGCLIALGGGLVSRQAGALPPTAIRPPGALPEPDFLGACVRCGLCVRACPFDTLKLGEFGDGVVPGTPYFEARDIPCEMCPDIPCVPVCPTGALDHGLTDIDDARMGLAVLIDQENCLNFLGLRCDVCYRVCPVIDKAITLELQHNPRSDRHALLLPTVHSEHCTGCGKCEKACILPDESAIKVLPAHLAKSSRSEHYLRGWEEKKAAGRSLIGDQMQLPVRGLEDREFGDTRDVGRPSLRQPAQTPEPAVPPASQQGNGTNNDTGATTGHTDAQPTDSSAFNGGLKSDWKP